MRVQTLTLKPHGEDTHASKSPQQRRSPAMYQRVGRRCVHLHSKKSSFEATRRLMPEGYNLYSLCCAVIARNATALWRPSGRQYLRRMREQHNKQLHGWAGRVARAEERRGAYRVLVGKREGKWPLGRPRLRWKDNIKMYFNEIGGQGHGAGFCRSGNETISYIKCGKFIYLRNY